MALRADLVRGAPSRSRADQTRTSPRPSRQQRLEEARRLLRLRLATRPPRLPRQRTLCHKGSAQAHQAECHSKRHCPPCRHLAHSSSTCPVHAHVARKAARQRCMPMHRGRGHGLGSAAVYMARVSSFERARPSASLMRSGTCSSGGPLLERKASISSAMIGMQAGGGSSGV